MAAQKTWSSPVSHILNLCVPVGYFSDRLKREVGFEVRTESKINKYPFLACILVSVQGKTVGIFAQLTSCWPLDPVFPSFSHRGTTFVMQQIILGLVNKKWGINLVTQQNREVIFLAKILTFRLT